MKNLAYHILDIVHNALQAEADLVKVIVDEQDQEQIISISIEDNGKGMDREQMLRATDPYYTSRKTRHVGMGLPLLKQNAEQTGGNFHIDSKPGEGTRVHALFRKNHLDCPSKGDLVGIIHQLIIGNAASDFYISYTRNDQRFDLDTRELKEILEGVPLYQKEISSYIQELIRENLKEIKAMDGFSYTT